MLAESRRVIERSRGTELERTRTPPSSAPSMPSMGASAEELLRAPRPPAARAPRSSSPRPRTMMRGPGAPGSVRVLRLGMAEASAWLRLGLG